MITDGSLAAWSSPANIALVKYWGKKEGVQVPANPSISFTLDSSRTITSIKFGRRDPGSDGVSFDYRFDGREHPAFASRVKRYLELLLEESECQYLYDFHLHIESKNTFPHSTGLASSASGMSSIALCLADVEREPGDDDDAFYRRASHLAHLGSGSACRSVYPYGAIWRESDSYAGPVKLHPKFKNYCDTILIISSEEKAVSSRTGHSLMDNNPYASVRYQTARSRAGTALEYLESGDEQALGALIEREALELHGLMGASEESYILLLPASLAVMQAVRKFRQNSNIPLYFTLDAGANVHLLYPREVKSTVDDFIATSLSSFLEDGSVIEDQVGTGPRRISQGVEWSH